MGTNPLEFWSHLEGVEQNKEDHGDLFPFPHNQTNFLDVCSGYAALDYQYELPIQEDAFNHFHSMETFPNDPFSYLTDYSFSFNSSGCMLQDVVGDVWNETGSNHFHRFNCNEVNALNDQNGQLLNTYFCDNKEEINNDKKLVGKTSKRNTAAKEEERSSNSSKKLSRNVISKYFYMPITQAAKELNIGLTLLKKRCRELGIRRWPHRKLNSLQTLIKNVQEMDNQGAHDKKKLREALEILEHEKKLLEEIPDMDLEDKTKRLRQACFKANYKKRKLMSMVNPQSLTYSNHSSGDAARFLVINREEEEEKMKFLVACGGSNFPSERFHA